MFFTATICSLVMTIVGWKFNQSSYVNYAHQYPIAQDDSLQLIRKISGNFSQMTADVLGNVYLLSQDLRLKKYNPNGDSLSVFNDVKKYGKVYSMDATNPLKLLLYYRDFSTVVELDRMLNPQNAIDLRKLNIFQQKAVALANDNNIWVYDELESQLKKVRQDGTLQFATTDLRQVLTSLPSPKQISDQDATVYLYDPQVGVLQFDYFGTYKNTIPLLQWQDFQVIGKFIFGRKGNALLRYEIGSMNLVEKKMETVFQQALSFRITPGRLYVLKKEGLYVYNTTDAGTP